MMFLRLEKKFIENLSLIDSIVYHTCRRKNFRPEETEEFSSYVRLKFIEDNYRVLRKFRGKCKLSTYLITVIQRFAIDFRITKCGKWRASTAALKAGKFAEDLEALLYRDLLPFEEACQILLQRYTGECTREELEKTAMQLAPRRPLRPIQVEMTDTVSSAPGEFFWEAHTKQNAVAARLENVISRFLSSLSSEDRLVLKLRFHSGLAVPEIARLLEVNPKRLYRQIEHLVDKIRAACEEDRIDLKSFGEEDRMRISKIIQISFSARRGKKEKNPSNR